MGIVDDPNPTVREILDGEAPFDSRAVHDENTGMYVMPEPEPVNLPDMVEDAKTGLFLPKPSTKQVTRLVFEGGQTIDVDESVNHVLELLSEHKSGDVRLSGPVFADEPVIIRAAYVKKILCVTVDHRDLAAIELQMKQNEYNQRMAEQQITQARAQNLGRNNGFPRQRRR